ncbi:DUF6881 domain-containing protein [Streptomyces sp. NPDC056738]|uniref:DUF6881 domain-containing protein n=1 Tax=Streptomyces sp. NPDC056738 TaxID=3345933 RepID=UPI0036D098E9
MIGVLTMSQGHTVRSRAMPERDGLSGAFCLVRLLSLLEAAKSPLTSAVESVAEALLVRGDVSEDLVILLDDYRQAAGEQIGFDLPPVGFEVWVCEIAILACGAEARAGRPPVETALRDARAVWGELSTLAAGVSRTATVVGLRATEEAWQEEDAQVAAAAEGDPGLLDRHLARLRTVGAVNRSALEELVAELGWQPTGPCRGTGCDWPSCSSETEEPLCLHRRGFQPQQTLGAVLRRKKGRPSKPWFVRVMYLEAPDDEPFEILSEVGEMGFETRKIVSYIDGTRVQVDASSTNARIGLETEPFRSLAEWRLLEVFAEELSEQFFEEQWASDY